jgi:hypothetical protein
MLRIAQIILGFGVGLLLLLWAWSVPVHWRDLDVALLPEMSIKGESLKETEQRALQEGNIGVWRWCRTILQADPSVEANRQVTVDGGWMREWELQQGVGSSYWSQTFPSEEWMKLQVLEISKTSWPDFASEFTRKVRSLQDLTGRRQFPPPGSAAERPWLASLEMLIWLSNNQGISASLEKELLSVLERVGSSDEQIRADAIQQFEGFQLSLLSLGRRYHWDELPLLTRAMARMEDAPGLAQMVAQFSDKAAWIGLSVHYLGRVHPLLTYRATYPESWLEDIQTAIEYGRYPLRYIILQQLPLYTGFLGSWSHWIRSQTPLANWPTAAEVVSSPLQWQRIKVVVLFISALFLALGFAAMGRLRPIIRSQRLPWWSPLLVLRQAMITLVLGGVLLWLCEPGVLRPPQTDVLLQQANLHLQSFSNNEPTELIEESHMIAEFDALTLFMLGLFFSLQFLLYVIGLLKLAQIRRLQLEPAVKLELLDNEDTLFDCGLYLGLGGTVVALVLLAMHILQPSLVAAYSSTLFGILFVALLKVYHVRPYRRQLLLNKENIVAL